MTNKIGRPRFDSEERRIPISLAMSPSMVAAIDVLKMNESRSEYVERMIMRALEG